MLDHLSHALHTFPVFLLVGMRERALRPVAVDDVTRLLVAALAAGRLADQTLAVIGPEAVPFGEIVRRVACVLGKRPRIFGLPVPMHRMFAWYFERVMTVPLIASAQVRMLAEGMTEPLPPCSAPPADLMPRVVLDEAVIRRGLPASGGFTLRDCRLAARLLGT